MNPDAAYRLEISAAPLPSTRFARDKDIDTTIIYALCPSRFQQEIEAQLMGSEI
jgi:hypothetical protein